MSFYTQTRAMPAAGSAADELSAHRRRRKPRWGVVMCPDGPHSVDLRVMRVAMTRLIVAGELSTQPVEDLARKAGVSRSTVSRHFNGRGGLRTLLAVLAVLGLAFGDVVSDTVMPTEGVSEP